jgi:hypothetical protein
VDNPGWSGRGSDLMALTVTAHEVGSLWARLSRIQQFINVLTMSPNEVRQLEGMSPIC